MTGPWPARAILLDLDGTLLDTAPDLAAAINAMLVELDRPTVDVATVAGWVGKGADVLVHRALTGSFEQRAEVALFERAKASFYRHYRLLNGRAAVLFDGVLAALDQWRAKGLALACVTNKPREFTHPLLAHFKLTDRLDAVVSGDDTVEKKPHAAPLLAACQRLGVLPADAVMVGDSENDLLSARAAGCRVVLVEWGYNEGRPVSALPADAIVAALADAVALVAAPGGHPSKP